MTEVLPSERHLGHTWVAPEILSDDERRTGMRCPECGLTWDEREGSTPSRAMDILRQPVPRGGFGRMLTSTEVRDLRRAGYRVPRGSIVVRSADVGSLHIVYYPARGGGYDHAGIYVAPK